MTEASLGRNKAEGTLAKKSGAVNRLRFSIPQEAPRCPLYYLLSIAIFRPQIAKPKI
jgi:hypothetical protein